MKWFWALIAAAALGAIALLALRAGPEDSPLGAGTTGPARPSPADAAPAHVPVPPSTLPAPDRAPPKGVAPDPTPAPAAPLPAEPARPARAPTEPASPEPAAPGPAPTPDPTPDPALPGTPDPAAPNPTAAPTASPPATPDPAPGEPPPGQPAPGQPAPPGDAKPALKVTERDDGTLRVNDRFVITGAGTPENPYEIPWEFLASAQETYRPRLGQKLLPPWLDLINGKHVRITGYIAFPIVAQEPDEMLMMLNQWDGCCIGVPPTPYDAVEVKLAKPPVGEDRLAAYGSVTGRFKVDPYLVKDWLIGLYTMDAATLKIED
ncbi:MAG TPA: hypothetical protein VD963_02055 [Phycisphaerales bacterium]|nr:hypothetical protein [Phycisphaerales bacterium]